MTENGHRGSPLSSSTLSPLLVALALALLLGLQPLTTDLWLPALPALARDFAAPMPAVQLTMSALILSFGVSQLAWGPLADRFGRRPVLRVGLTLYVLASVAAALAPTIGLVIVARVVQGASVSAAIVCARAMVRDLYEPHEGAHIMARAMSGLGVIAVLSPAVGGLVAAAFGWRAALGVVAFVAALTLWFVWARVPETARQLNPDATRIGQLGRQWVRILRHPGFLAWAGLTASTYGGLFIFLSGSSFVYIGLLHVPVSAYGLIMGSASAAYIAGTFACRRWLVRVGMAGAVKRGALFTLSGGLMLAALTYGGAASIWPVIVCQWLYCFGHGIHQPCSQVGAVAPFPQAAGMAAALAGFMLAFVAFAVGQWLGVALDGTMHPFGYGVGAWSVVTTLVAWTLVQRSGEPRGQPAPANA